MVNPRTWAGTGGPYQKPTKRYLPGRITQCYHKEYDRVSAARMRSNV